MIRRQNRKTDGMKIRVIRKALFLSICLVVFGLIGMPAFADTMAVEALTPISTDNPKAPIKLRVVKHCTLGTVDLKTGYVLKGHIMTVTDPKRLKRNASFTFAPVSYIDLDGKETQFNALYEGKYSANFEIDAGKMAKSAALTVGNQIISGFKMGYQAVEGAIENEEGNAVKSAAKNVYENSVFSYCEKGGHLHIQPFTPFGLKFDECENADDD